MIDNVKTTASSIDGERKKIKLIIMVNEHPTYKDATVLFNKILNNIEKNSARSGVWDYYEAYFEIKAYDSDVIYTATKHINNDLKVLTK